MSARPAGFYNDIPEADYHADRDSLSVSGAKLLLQAPALYRWALDHPKHSDAFDFGSAAHGLVLGVGAPIAEIHFDDWRTKAAQAARDDARAQGHVPLLYKDAQKVRDMADALSSHTLAMHLLSDGKPEVSAYAEDPDTGVLRRGRFDFLGPRVLTDYKTSVTADPDAFGRTAATYGYHQQAAWYLDLARDLGHPAGAFAFIVQMKEPPYLVTVVTLDQRAEDRGRELNRRALDLYARCRAEGRWPSYAADDTFAVVDIPRWAYFDDDAVLETTTTKEIHA